MRKISFEENHIHSTYSDGRMSLEEIFDYNHTHDKLDLIIADHVDHTTKWFPRYIAHIKRLRRQYPDFSVRIGCEVKILDSGKLNANPKLLQSAEVVLGSVHFFDGIHTMGKAQLLKREYELTKLLAQNKDIDILAHPFSMSERFYHLDPPPAYIRQVYALCRKNAIRFECNGKHALANIQRFVTQKLSDPTNRRHFSFGSDVHKHENEIGQAAFSLATPVTVMLTGGGTAIAQGLIKAIKLSKVPTRLVVVDHDPMTAGLYRADAAYTIPLATQPGYIERLIQIGKKERAELLLVGTDVELTMVTRHRRQIERATGMNVLISPPRAVTIADDKWLTIQFLKHNGFSYPASTLPAGRDAWLKRHNFPVIVKPRQGARAVGFSIIRSRAELESVLPKLDQPIIQEYLSNDDQEYTTGVFVMGRKVHGTISLRRWLRNGDTYKAIIEHQPAIERYVAKVALRLGINGPCNFQLRRVGHKYKIFEINCRFSGTTATQSGAGFNVLNTYLQYLFFRRPIKPLSFRPAVMLRYWNEMYTSFEQVKQLERHGHLAHPESMINTF